MRKIEEFSPQELLEMARQADADADALLREIQNDSVLQRDSRAVGNFGVLRQRAQEWRNVAIERILILRRNELNRAA